MKKFWLAAACLLAVATGSWAQDSKATDARVQDLQGAWQGSLPAVPPATDPRRIVLRFVKMDDGSLRASCYHLGTGGAGMPMSTMTFAPPAIETEQAYAGFGFKGKLSADGKSMDGTWTEGKVSSPMTFALATPETVWKLDYAVDKNMAADADPSFEVATIKPTEPGQGMKRYGIRTRSFKAVNQSVSELIEYAYQVRARQIDGAPKWMDEEHFDLAGKPDLPGQPSEDQYRLMLRKLLADRFALKTHTVPRVFPVYALTLDKNPPALTRSDLTVDGYHTSIYTRKAADGQFEAQMVFASMQDFAGILMNFIRDRQIVDETGLKGRYDFTMKLPAEMMTGGMNGDDLTNAFIEAVHSLGFKLVPKKEAIDVMVVDHVEQPSDN